MEDLNAKELLRLAKGFRMGKKGKRFREDNMPCSIDHIVTLISDGAIVDKLNYKHNEDYVHRVLYKGYSFQITTEKPVICFIPKGIRLTKQLTIQ